MPNPSYDYQQYVLANLPSDITFNENGKDGLFTFNRMKFSNYLDALHMKWYVTSNGYIPPSAVFISKTDPIAGSAHSFLAFAMEQNGDGGTNLLQERWESAVYVNYLGFSTLKQRWDVDGVDRTADYDGALWLTEFTNPAEGWPAWDSAASIESLQYFYYYALTAQAKGCKAVYIYPPWSPEGLDVDAATVARAESWKNWLQSKVSIPVYILPVPQIVRAWRNSYSPQSIFSDGLHLRSPTDPAPNQFYLALALSLEYMMTREQPDLTDISTEVQTLFSTCKSSIDDLENTGLGGTTTVTPDNTTDPLPYPESILKLTDNHTISANMVETSLTTSSVNLASNGNTGNKTWVFPSPPVGSRVRFTVSTTSGMWRWRHGNSTLGSSVNIWSSSVPVTDVEIDYIVTEDYFNRGFMGMISNTTVSDLSIRNFRVTAP